jgi:hypothetical protein
MITIDDTVDWGGQYFSTPKKNLGNKLFMYIGARLISDLLDINLIVPDKAIIRRESNFDNQWIDQYFPFKSILNRKEIKEPIIDLNNGTFQHYSINDIVENYKSNEYTYELFDGLRKFHGHYPLKDNFAFFCNFNQCTR